MLPTFIPSQILVHHLHYQRLTLFFHESLFFMRDFMTNVVTSTPPPSIKISSLANDYSSTLPTIVALDIKPPTKIVDDISKDTHILSNNKFNTPIIPSPLENLF